MSKTIILAVPYLYGLDQCIEKNLQNMGYQVINLCFDNSRTRYPTFFHRLIGTFHRKVLKNRNYDKKMTYSFYQQEIKEKLAVLNGEQADFALCIRANVYPLEIIEEIRQKSKKCVNYQWDGIDAHPDILNYLHYFDDFFVFDKNDIAKYPEYKFKPTTNFYFDYPIVKENSKKHNGIYFLGGHQESRVKDISQFLDEIVKLGENPDFYVISKNNRAKSAFNSNPYIHYVESSNALSFAENLQKVAACKVVVDFLNDVHQGLSFRTFDALCFNKKLITNNKNIKQYEFYHPNNILVWTGENRDELAEFLQTPYIPLKPEIKEKYAFSHWFKTLVNA